MNTDIIVFFMLDDNNRILIKYSKIDDINESSFKNTIKIPTHAY